MCGWSFPFYMDLENSSAICQGPYWVPREALEGFEIEKLITDLHQRFCAAIHVHAPASVDKREWKKIKTRNGFVKFVRSRPDILSGVSNGSMPEMYAAVFRSGVLRKYILGQLGRHEANFILRNAISLRAIYRSNFEEVQGLNPITDGCKVLKQSWDTHFQRLEGVLKLARDLLRDSEDLARRTSDLAKTPHKHVADAARHMKIVVRDRVLEIKRFLRRPIDFSQCSFIDCHKSSLLNNQFNANASAFINATAQKPIINFLQSDIADLLHSLYLPFCDLWRGDRRFSSILRIADVPFNEKIVSNLFDLPRRIDLLLSE
jgi:hypothetical protein